MKRIILFILFLCPVVFFGQSDSGSTIVGTIGGTVDVSVFGGATYYIPLEMPHGVLGMQPDLGIVYNSQAGNGLLGYGWNISGVSTINRTGSTLYHDGKMTAADFSSDDRFMLDGQRLVLVGSSGNSYEYKTENDEFSKIVFQKENGYYSKCEVRLENGNIIKYGYTSNSKLMAGDGNNVIKWMVSSISDRNGNTVSFLYETPGADSDIYISQITYTSNQQAGLTPEYAVSFTYSNNRFDKYHYYIAGNKVQCDRILNGIDISKNNQVIESYAFTYDGNTGRMYNILKEISFSKGGCSLNPTVIQWNTVENDIQNNTLYSQEVNSAMLDKVTFVGDFNGDGYSDLLTAPYKPINGYTGNVNLNIYLNDMYGEFSSTPDCTLSAADSLEWIHVIDINGDGYDDIVLQTLTSSVNGNSISYNSGFVIYESSNGTSFNYASSFNISDQIVAKTGDFLGEGRNSLLLLRLEGVDDITGYSFIYEHPAVIHYDNSYMLNTFGNTVYYIGDVLSDDFNGDGKTEIMVLDGDYRAVLSFGRQNGQYAFSTVTEQFHTDNYASYFTGDFNNDGMADIILNDHNNDKYVVLSTGSGFTGMIKVMNTNMNTVVFPAMRLYNYSLAYVDPNVAFVSAFVDIDGDGKTDLVYYDGTKKPKFYKDMHFTVENNILRARFKTEYVASNEDIRFTNQYFTIGNFLGRGNLSFIAIDPNSDATPTDDAVKVFSFPSASEIFSVGSITDGMGNATQIEYGYLMPGNAVLYSFGNRPFSYDVKPMPLPVRALKSYTEHIGSNDYRTSYRYTNALMHRTGRGFIGFDNIEKTTYINNSPVRLETCRFELATTGVNAMALPQCDSTFVFNNGVKCLAETNEYVFQNIRCSRQATSDGRRLIARPAMTTKKTKTFNPDVQGALMAVDFIKYQYSYTNSQTYSNTYRCSSILTGRNRNDCNSYNACEYKNALQFSYKSDNYTTWVINIKTQEKSQTLFADKPAVKSMVQYSYSAVNPFMISYKTDSPSFTATDPQTVRHDYQYDACGNVISETVSAPNGIHNEPSVVTSFTYSNYRMVSATTRDPNGLAYQEQYTYDTYDRLLSHTGSNGLTTQYVYNNPFGSSKSSQAPGGILTTETLSWAASDNLAPSGALYLKRVSISGKPTTKTFYDANGNVLRTATQNHALDQVLVDIQYNDRQQPTQQSNPYLSGDTPLWTTFSYDGLGRLTTTTAPDGKTTHNVYDGYTTTTTVSDGVTSRTSEQVTNYLGWVTSNTDASGAEVTYDYYSDGKPALMSTSDDNAGVAMTYDNARNRVSLSDSDYGTVTSVYDAYGRLMEQTTPKSDVTQYTYDVLGRVIRKNETSDDITTIYQYNESSHKGTLASVVHNNQTLNYTYDQYDRLTVMTDMRADTSYTTLYDYDNHSRIERITHPSGYRVDYEYYPNGAGKYVKDSNGNILWQTDGINAFGQLLQATTGNGAVTTNTYDAVSSRLASSSTSNGIQSFAYTFDKFGNLTSRTDSIGTVKTETFTYDNLDRLTGISFNNVGSSMVYDSYGRMTSKQRDGSFVFTSAHFGHRKPHATTSVRSASNTFPTEQAIEYYQNDKVKMIAQGTKIATFTYGHDALRIRMTVTDTLSHRTITKDYVGSCEFVDDNGSKKVYTYLKGPYGVFAFVEKANGRETLYYVYKDHLGSWTAITDDTGYIVERRSFDAWGNLRDAVTWSGIPQRFPRFDRGFTGHEHLYAFGLINMNGRMYDPALSAFLSPDNYMQDVTTQQGFNRYAYCMYNPLKYVDPSGELCRGWGSSTYYLEMAFKNMMKERYSQYLELMEMTLNHINEMIDGLFSMGDNTGGMLGENHGCGGGSQSPYIEVKEREDGTYEVVGGVADGNCKVYIVDDQGNRIGELGETITSNSFFDKGKLVEGSIIDFYDLSGQIFYNKINDNTPAQYYYAFGEEKANGQNFGDYDFKAIGSDNIDKELFLQYYNRGMLFDYGNGAYIATARDIGNFVAGFVAGKNGVGFIVARIGFDWYHGGIEPKVSRCAQNKGYFWGLRCFFGF